MTRDSFARALQFGAQLAARDGLLYLGACGPAWAVGTLTWHASFYYAKAASFCTHALAVTRHAGAFSCHLAYTVTVSTGHGSGAFARWVQADAPFISDRPAC